MVLLRIAGEEQDPGDEVDGETEQGPWHQALQRPERDPLRHAEDPQIDDADDADEHGHADEVQAFAQRQHPPGAVDNRLQGAHGVAPEPA